MPFDIVRETTTIPAAFVPVVKKKVTDAAGDADVDMGVAGLQVCRVRIKVTSLGGTSPTFDFAILLDDVATFASPEVVHRTATFGAVTGAEWELLLGPFVSDDGFRYVRLDVTLGGTGPTISYDAIVEAA